MSHSNKDVDESLSTTLYAVPIVLVNPYLAGGLFVDYLLRGRYRIIPSHPMVLTPDELTAWARPASADQLSVAQSSSAVYTDGAWLMLPASVMPASSESSMILIAEPNLQEVKEVQQ